MIAFNFGNAKFDYRPYPVCYIPSFFDQDTYQKLVDTYPDFATFGVMDKYNHKKYSLSETYNADTYHAFFAKHPLWKEFYDHVKSKAFVEEVLAFLKQNNIDLGFKKRLWYRGGIGEGRSKWKKALATLLDRKMVTSKFEFSMLPAHGGQVVPHTDSVNKNITLIFSFMPQGEWDESWGGGTSICRTKDERREYNHINEVLPFEETEVIKTFPFVPNQCLMFIKTYNSLHSVLPMTGPEGQYRKTVTAVIKSFS